MDLERGGMRDTGSCGIRISHAGFVGVIAVEVPEARSANVLSPQGKKQSICYMVNIVHCDITLSTLKTR